VSPDSLAFIQRPGCWSEASEFIGLDNVNDYYDVRLKKARLAKLKPFKQFTFTKTIWPTG